MSLARTFRLTGLVGVALFFATAFTPLAQALSLWMAVEPELVPSDAIVVLGATVSPSGILSAESTRRTDHMSAGGVAVVLVVALRTVANRFVSVYVTDDTVWLGLALFQGLVFQSWRAVSGRKAGGLLLEERGELG